MNVVTTQEVAIDAETEGDGVWFRWNGQAIHLEARHDGIRVHVGTATMHIRVDDMEEVLLPDENGFGLLAVSEGA